MNNKIENVKKGLYKITATNKSPIYNTMLYWAQKPYNITDYLIQSLTSKDSIIMDPFMGSGVTILEASNKQNNQKSIGVDINDMPIFLCKNSAFVPKKETIENLDNVKSDLIKYNNNYYTTCDKCGNKHAIIKKIIYDIEPEQKIKTLTYECSCSKKPLEKEADSNDIREFNKKRKISYIEDIQLIPNSRIAVKEGEKISDKFSRRSFYVLDCIKGYIENVNDPETKKVLFYVYASIIHKTKILDVKLSSQWPLWIPKKNCVERNVLDIFNSAIEKYKESRDFVDKNYNSNFVNSYCDLVPGASLIIQKGIQNIDENQIPSKCVDLVITDPPYLGQVPYSEYMQLYKPFLNNTIDYENEIVITNAKGRKKDYEEYMDLMQSAFKNVSRMMKHDSILCMYFHDSNLNVWNDLIRVMEEASLKFITCVHIDKAQKTLKKILDPKKTMSGETLIVFQKVIKQKNIKRSAEQKDYDEILKICKKIINENKEKQCTTSQLYDNGVMSYIINEGIIESLSVQYKDLIDIFSNVLNFNPDNGVWELK